jgi:hypothetical protein
MAKKPDKWMGLASGFLTGLVVVIIVLLISHRNHPFMH